KMLPRFRLIIAQYVVIQIEPVVRVVDVYIVANIERDIVIVDWVFDFPIPARITVFQVFAASQPAVGNVHETFRDSDFYRRALVWLIGLRVFARIPKACTGSLD